MSKEKYPLPQDVKDVFEESRILKVASDMFIDSKWNSYKKTIKACRESAKVELEAWSMVYELYPELKSKHILYRYAPQILVVKEIENG